MIISLIKDRIKQLLIAMYEVLVFLFIEILEIVRKAVPYTLTYLITKRKSHEPLWGRWYGYISYLQYRLLHKIVIPITLYGCKFLVRPFAGDLFAFKEVYIKRTYKRFLSPQKEEMVIDGGAHIGFFTIKASKVVGNDGLVIAVEPEPENFNLLCRNLKINSLVNVIPIKAALGGESRRGKLFLSVSIGHSLFSEASHFVEVPVITIDQLCKILGLPRVDLIKLNVEGAEYEVLEGAKLTLKHCKKLIIGTHGKELKEKVIATLQRSGYEVREKDGFVYAQKRNNCA
jgi:FkbM family methyltransferase